MKLNINLKDFIKNHKLNKNQVLYIKKNCKNYKKVENIFKFILSKKIVLFLSLLKKELLGEDTQLLVTTLTKFGILMAIN